MIQFVRQTTHVISEGLSHKSSGIAASSPLLEVVRHAILNRNDVTPPPSFVASKLNPGDPHPLGKQAASNVHSPSTSPHVFSINDPQKTEKIQDIGMKTLSSEPDALLKEDFEKLLKPNTEPLMKDLYSDEILREVWKDMTIDEDVFTKGQSKSPPTAGQDALKKAEPVKQQEESKKSQESQSSRFTDEVKRRVFAGIGAVITGLLVKSLTMKAEQREPQQIFQAFRDLKESTIEGLDETVQFIDAQQAVMEKTTQETLDYLSNHPDLDAAEKEKILEAVENKYKEDKEQLSNYKNKVVSAKNAIAEIEITRLGLDVGVNDYIRVGAIAMLTKCFILNPVICLTAAILMDVASDKKVSKEEAEQAALNFMKGMQGQIKELSQESLPAHLDLEKVTDHPFIANTLRLSIHKIASAFVGNNPKTLGVILSKADTLISKIFENGSSVGAKLSSFGKGALGSNVKFSLVGSLTGVVLGSATLESRIVSQESINEVLTKVGESELAFEKTKEKIKGKARELSASSVVFQGKIFKELPLVETQIQESSPAPTLMEKIADAFIHAVSSLQ